MKRKRSPSHLGLLFFLAVVVPCLVLGLIAIRSINREKAFGEMRVQRTIDAELVTTVSLLNADLDRIRQELGAGLTGEEFSSPQDALPRWRARSGLAGVPFLLSPDLKIIWPVLNGALSAEERAFLNWNREFVTGRAPIPVYQNIALLYKDEIAKPREAAPAPPAAELDRAEPSAAAGAKPVLNETKNTARGGPGPAESAHRVREKPRCPRSRSMTRPGKGDKKQRRATSLPARPFARQTSPPGPSPFISPSPSASARSRPARPSGLIPRFIEDKLTLLFWKKPCLRPHRRLRRSRRRRPSRLSGRPARRVFIRPPAS